MQALLNFDEYIVDELTIKTNKDFRPPKGPGKSVEVSGHVKLQFDIKQRNDRDTAYMIPLTIEVNGSLENSTPSPYYIFLAIRGFFSFNEKQDPETTARMISFNGLSMLYGVARGVVGQVTASCPHDKFVLPSMNFVELLKRKASEVAADVPEGKTLRPVSGSPAAAHGKKRRRK